MIEVSMGHDNPFYGCQLDPHLQDRLDLMTSFAYEAHVNEGKVLGGWFAYDIGMGVRNQFVLSWNEIYIFCYFGHPSFLMKFLAPVFNKLIFFKITHPPILIKPTHYFPRLFSNLHPAKISCISLYDAVFLSLRRLGFHSC
jgi:hypothetical protein